MTGYIVRRFAQLLPLMLAISVLMFFALRIVPGGPESMYARAGADAATLAAVRERLGLNQSLPLQYVRWLRQSLSGDLGTSYSTGRAVTREIADRLGPTLVLMGTTFVVVFIVAVALGVLSALKQYSRLDLWLTTFTFVGAAMPVFWLGLVLIIIDMAIRSPFTGRPFLPIGGMATPGQPFSVADLARHLVLPMLALGLGWVSWYARYVRSSMLEVIGLDFIRTARAKGLSERAVIFHHALRNAAIPLVTVVALDLPYLFAGALYIEIIFAWPGMGNFFYRAVVLRDYPVVMAVIMVVAALVLIGNLLADVLYAWLDPRIRYRR